MMIPKKIHYCWFGEGQKPELAVKCIESWKKFCPDYEIIEWNEENFDINSNLYVKQAYENRKFAFVSDYVRLYALVTCGGIYMDTDVMVLKNLDEYLENEAFSGFESKTKIPTGIMASVKDSPVMHELLKYYDDAVFLNDDGTFNMTTNVEIITGILSKHGFVPNGEKQTVFGFTFYPQNIFCPEHKKLQDNAYMKDTATIHWFSGSWKSEKVKKRESSLWWRICSKPAVIFSKLLRKVFGKNWDKVKKKIFKRIYK